ncbi:major facilitator superfamily domain-containing protein [Cokeromyces recurvatus]|uniref:major facilitator superfamily domain-containing protein n=1 Tax=Cokeromyces recurvatus TaxID=90255 RepID=UPI00221ED271|nr:major facilitator superfamily domain-containing protein [Cokeromyces recurvatus]KAI7903398.1 major facilitator superfamily domain-containing protein [Cokeromyces recurvatus]
MNSPNVYQEPHLYDPPSQEYNDHDNDAQDPMLPTVVANTLSNNDTSNSNYIRGPNNTIRIIFLTLCLAGLQFTGTVEMAYGTPYLLSLGLSKSFMSLVWIAGPLSGLIMQPIVGVISDSCESKWGRRRPFLIGGSLVVVISLLVIGWTREITWLFTRQEEGDTFKLVSIIIAIIFIYILDFSINCVQASCRALIVDSLPSSQQENGTAWAGRMVGLGNVAGYFMGYADLVRAFPFLGNTQLKVLCVLATLVLLACDFITCYTVKEKAFNMNDTNRQKRENSPFTLFSGIFKNIWHLPKPIQRICNVQFFAWIGWFPFLFYSTTWVAEIYNENLLENEDGEDRIGQATRAGSFAFLVYSLVSLSSSFLLPLFVTSVSKEKKDSSCTIRLFGKKEISLSWLGFFKLSFLTLPRAWTISHFIFCICMLSTFFVSDVTAAAVVIGLCGISWAISMWAPFSLLGEYIVEQQSRIAKYGSEEEEENDTIQFIYKPDMMASRTSLAGISIIGAEPVLYHPVAIEEEDIQMLGIKHLNQEQQLGHSSSSNSNSDNDNDQYEETYQNQQPPAAGVLLGIHNMYIVLPQFLVTFFSSIIFRILESGEDSRDTIGFILRIGAVMAGIAGFISLKIGKDE